MSMPQRRRYATNADRQRAYRHRHNHPRVQHVQAPNGPARYTYSLADLLTVGARFGCIYADPPWQYADQPPKGGADKHYGAMAVEDLCALPVAQLAADQAHCHLWVTNAFLFEAPRILAAWGFTYKSTFVWTKPRLGVGHYWRNAHEILLLGVRGGLTAQKKHLRSWIEAPSHQHSAKPDVVRDRIEQLSPGPYLELFGRVAVPGWTVWGNEVHPSQGRLFKEQI